MSCRSGSMLRTMCSRGCSLICCRRRRSTSWDRHMSEAMSASSNTVLGSFDTAVFHDSNSVSVPLGGAAALLFAGLLALQNAEATHGDPYVGHAVRIVAT